MSPSHNISEYLSGKQKKGMNQKKGTLHFVGFTLTELIVVITILTILSVIAFLSFQSYASSARDSLRMSTLSEIHKGGSLYATTAGVFPNPDNALDIAQVSFQGYVGEGVKRIIRMSGDINDPLDGSPYVYSVKKDKKKAQYIAYLENGAFMITSFNPHLPFLSDTAFADTGSGVDYSKRFYYTFGDAVGVVIDPTTNAPVNATFSGTLNLSDASTTSYTAVFSNATSGSGTITSSGASLVTEISIIQNSCVLGNTVIKSGESIKAYKVSSVAYDQTCEPSSLTRKCTSGILDGNKDYAFDTCSPAAARNCSAVGYNGYSVPIINHLASQTITKTFTGGSASMLASCTDGTLTYGTESVNCDANYVLQSGGCAADICTGSAPEYSIANGTQKLGNAWLHSTTSGVCTFVCQAGYYYNSPNCTAASLGYIVSASGSLSQTPCNASDTYQDVTAQSSCKTVADGYYSTPVGNVAHTGQSVCEANSYCTNGIKTACPIGYHTEGTGSMSVGDCAINSYVVSGSFGANANGATINVCGTNVIADTSGNFTATREYNASCNTITATRTGYTCTTATNGPASLTSNISNIAGNCTLNAYVVSGSFGANGSGATITGCTNKTATANASGSFSFSSGNYGTACNDIIALRNNYTCTTTTNGPASLTSAVSNVAGNCTANTQVVSCGGSIPTNATASTPVNYTQTWNGSIWTPTTSWSNGGATCGYACNANYTYSAGACNLNTYTISGSFGTNANSATITGCGKSVTADASGNFSFTNVAYRTACDTITASRTNYTCSTTTNGPAFLTSAISNVAGNCTANTQVANCATLSTGSKYFNGNTTYSITQTWNGSAWAPATTQSYSATPTTNTCQYNCTATYSYNGTTCAPRVACSGYWTACSGGSQTFYITTPASNGGAGCDYQGGTTQSCGTAGVCGSDNGKTFGNSSSSVVNLCSVGSPTTLTDTLPMDGWQWQCNGLNGGSNTWCFAYKKGASSDHPGSSCKDIQNAGGSPASGVYWIKIDSNPAFQVYCDMTTSGGGWMVVASDGTSPLYQNLPNFSNTPSATTAGIVPNLTAANLKSIATEMRVTSVSSASNYTTFDLTQSFLGSSVVLDNSGKGYYFSDGSGFEGGATSAHKCNFSIMVIGQQGCQIGYASGYPANGISLGATDTGPNVNCGAVPYSWQFYGGGTLFRVGWTVPGTCTAYYNDRTSAYIMIR